MGTHYNIGWYLELGCRGEAGERGEGESYGGGVIGLTEQEVKHQSKDVVQVGMMGGIGKGSVYTCTETHTVRVYMYM